MSHLKYPFPVFSFYAELSTPSLSKLSILFSMLLYVNTIVSLSFELQEGCDKKRNGKQQTHTILFFINYFTSLIKNDNFNQFVFTHRSIISFHPHKFNSTPISTFRSWFFPRSIIGIGISRLAIDKLIN